jgi:hypothetical protein
MALRYVEQALDRGGYFDPTIRNADWRRKGQRTLSEAFPTRTVSRGGPIATLPESGDRKCDSPITAQAHLILGLT